MADFIDFNAWRDLTSAGERDLLERQQEDVARKAMAADQLLSRSRAEAERTGQSSLSATASYGDYLKAKQAALDARALMILGRDSEYGSTRSTLDAESGYSKDAQSALDRLSAHEGRAGTDVAGNAASFERSKQFWAGEQAKKDAEAQRRQQAGDEATQRYIAALTAGAKGRAGAGGTQKDYVGGYNPYASSDWAQQQGAFEAQQLRNAGGSDEQARSIWDAYTAKGEMGSSATPRAGGKRNPYANMYESMSPYGPKDG